MSSGSNDPSFTERFTREAKTLAKLSHPNIVTVFDFGQSNSMSYLVMEYIDGVNLRDAIQLGRIRPDRALEIVQQICGALQYAHDAGIIHRDIKPENILIDRRGHVKIADFGLAKLLVPNPDEFTLTGTRQVLGTMNYMAPEQIEKPDTVDHRADLYSLGVVLYELLTGELPIGRFAPPSEKTHGSIGLNTKGLDEVVLRTLEKEPDRRFQQASRISSAMHSLEEEAGENGDNKSMPVSEIVESVAGYRDAGSGQSTRNRRNDSVTDSIPFSLGYVPGKWHSAFGTARCMGLVRAFEDRIELDIEIREAMLPHAISEQKFCLTTWPRSNFAIRYSAAGLRFNPQV